MVFAYQRASSCVLRPPTATIPFSAWAVPLSALGSSLGRWSLPLRRERKVRTPQGSMPRKNPRRAGAQVPVDGKCHRKQTAAARLDRRRGKGEKAG